MTRAEYVAVCRQCKNRGFDVNSGVICALTNKVADFEGKCAGFLMDELVVPLDPELVNGVVEVSRLGEDVKEKLRKEQNFNFALIGGLIALMVSAIVWAVISIAVEAQIGYMAMGVGIVTGLAIRFFGGGIDKKFQILGAVLALIGCVMGNLLTQIGFIARMDGSAFLYIFSFIDLYNVISLLLETFHPVDILFYIFSIIYGFHYSIIRLTPSMLERIKAGNDDHRDLWRNKLRMPLAIAGIIIIVLVFSKLKEGYSGPLSEKNEAGIVTSSGVLKKNKPHGHWTFFYPNSIMEREGNLIEGELDGLWKYYNEDGTLKTLINYSNDLENGMLINYHPNGKMADSSYYINGRADGISKTWYESGILRGIMNWKRDILNGEMRLYYETGQLMSLLNYVDDTAFIIEQYNADGMPMVKEGNGIILNYYDNGTISSEIRIVNGKKNGLTTEYYVDGTLKLKGDYIDNELKILDFWSPEGHQMVINGNGKLNYYSTDSTMTEGYYLNGYPEGSVYEYYISGAMKSSSTYAVGKANGNRVTYNENESLSSTCSMKDGKYDGEAVWYTEDGVLISKASFVNGKKTGVQVFYARDGSITKNEYWENGVFVREVVE